MRKKSIVISAVIAVGVISAYEIYKNNIKTYSSNFYKSEIVHSETILADSEERIFFTKPQIKPQDVNIKIYKKIRILELYGDDKLIGRFKIALGSESIGDKDKEGDMKTPEGKYYICTRNDKSNYTLFLGLSYPNVEDARRGVEQGLISESEFEKIQIEVESGRRPAWETALGGAIGIHGGGTRSDWTWGCVAVSDNDIKIIWEYTKMNTPVEVFK